MNPRIETGEVELTHLCFDMKVILKGDEVEQFWHDVCGFPDTKRR